MPLGTAPLANDRPTTMSRAAPGSVPEAAWRRLSASLDRWAAAGRRAPIWWRDDDAVAPGPALDRLLALTRRAEAPLVLAVIPAGVEPALADRLAERDADHVTIAQHGWSHANHAPPGEKKAELGDHRPAATVWAELAEGRQRLTWLLGAQAGAMLVPPWNRLGTEVAGGLARLGYGAVSLFGDAAPPVDPAVDVINTQCDPIAWKAGRGLAPDALDDLTDTLDARLGAGKAGDAPPVGLLTHHAAHNGDVWGFVERLAATIAEHPGARWTSPTDRPA
jgi:hypothetical protein